MTTLRMPMVPNPHPYGPPVPCRTVEILHLINVCAREWGVKVAHMLIDRREREVVVPRQVAMYLAWRHTGFSLTAIGQVFGGRDHTTVLYAARKIRQLLAEDDNLAQRIARIEQQNNL